MPNSLVRPPKPQESFSGRRQGRGRQINIEVITRGLPRDRNRYWVRKLWTLRKRGDVETFAAYIQNIHPHKIPPEVCDVREYVCCMLRGLLGRDDL
jgi:hypothetical protein